MKPQPMVTALMLVAVLAGISAPRVQAQGGPVIDFVHLDDTFVTGFCGFPLEVRTTGTGVFHFWFDDGGALERLIITSAAIQISFTNLDTGESIWTPSVNMTRVTVDGDSAIQTYRGLLWRLVLPHEGLVTADVGRIDFAYSLDEQGNPVLEGVTFVAGQQEDQFIQAMCVALGS